MVRNPVDGTGGGLRPCLCGAARKITLGRAARIAGLPQAEFLKGLGRRGIPIHYDVADFAADLETLAALKNDRRQ